MDIQSALNLSVNITEITQGRSVAIINVRALREVLRGENTIVCQGENTAGSTTGTIVLQGICKHDIVTPLHSIYVNIIFSPISLCVYSYRSR